MSKCGPELACTDPSECCSQYGYCGTGNDWCGPGCQSGPCTQPSPTPPVTIPPTEALNLQHATADNDSRLIAYVGNWQPCPTPIQSDAYTHIVVAFAVTYKWTSALMDCNANCEIVTDNTDGSINVCDNSPQQDLVSSWKKAGKKVLLSFGGASMGGSWFGDNNNCWDACFGKEDELSTSLVDIIRQQNFDGIDIDYEYCYDTNNRRHGGCWQTSDLYSDEKAQSFISTLTSQLRTRMDALGPGYELTHAPMDTDLVPDSPYYRILKEQRDKLDFLMPQFYNGITQPATDKFDGTPGLGKQKAAVVYNNLVNDLFDGQPEKVIFGFCISDCSAMGSNVNGNQAVDVLRQVKAYNDMEYSCNGGAFFWVAEKDVGGSWSDLVWEEVKTTSGCSSRADDFDNNVIPIKFEVRGLPNDFGGSIVELKNEMTTILYRILFALEERIGGFKVLDVEDNEDKNTDPFSIGEEHVINMYYNVIIKGDNNTNFGPIVIEELRDSYDDVLEEIPFDDVRYIGTMDLQLNWCTNTDSGEYIVCVHDTQQLATQSTEQSTGTNRYRAEIEGSKLPSWGIALLLLMIICVMFIFYIMTRRRRDQLNSGEERERWDYSYQDGRSQSRRYMEHTSQVQSRRTDSENGSYRSSRMQKRMSNDPPESHADCEGPDLDVYISSRKDRPDRGDVSVPIIEDDASSCRLKPKLEP